MAHLSACAVDLNRVPAYNRRNFHTLNLEQALVSITPAPPIFKAAGALRGFTVSSRCILPNSPANLFSPSHTYLPDLSCYHLQANPVIQVAGFSRHSIITLLIE